jgi:hypothetical protein
MQTLVEVDAQESVNVRGGGMILEADVVSWVGSSV